MAMRSLRMTGYGRIPARTGLEPMPGWAFPCRCSPHGQGLERIGVDSGEGERPLRNPAPVSMCQTFPVTDAALWTAGQTYQCMQRTALRSLANGAGGLIDVLRELAAAED